MSRLKIRALALPVLVLAMLAFAPAAVSAQEPGPPPERFFDTASAPVNTVRLTIFYPAPNTLRHILALKAQGFIPYDNLEIVGVYHIKERTNYRESVRLVEENKLSNIHFHAVSADLDIASLYRKNAATAEFRKIFDLSNAIIFFGGPDMPPAAYGEKMDFKTIVTDPNRHYLELSMIYHLLGGSQNDSLPGFLKDRPNVPVMGICLGMQSLNVGTGGTMIQDLWSEVYGANSVEEAIALGQQKWHKNPYEMNNPLERNLVSYMPHQVKILGQSRIWTALGMTTADRPYVGSAHHQAVEKLGKGFKVIATSLDDKIIESIEHETFPNVFGVQFHPEYRKLWDTTPEFKIAPQDPDMFGYRTFLEANPPSFEFHKKLWTWFFTKVKGAESAS